MSTAKTAASRATPSREIDTEVGRRVHMRMWDSKLTHEAVARSIGLDTSSFSKRLRGERKWALIELVNVAAVLRTTVAYLVGETDDPRPVGPDGDLIDVDPGRIELPTSCLQTRHLAEVIPIRAGVAA